MTYNDLITQLQQLTAQQLNTDVTVYSRETDEFYPLSTLVPLAIAVGGITDVIDEGNPYLII